MTDSHFSHHRRITNVRGYQFNMAGVMYTRNPPDMMKKSDSDTNSKHVTDQGKRFDSDANSKQDLEITHM